MVDANIKKIIIPKEDLPSVGVNDLSYSIRYRLISEDKNRTSHWSKIENIAANPITALDYTVFAKNADSIVTSTWNPKADLGISNFDVYVRWVGNTDPAASYPWEYWTTVSSNSYSWAYPTLINTPSGGTEAPHKVQVAVQRPTYPKEKENYPTVSSVTLFESALITL